MYKCICYVSGLIAAILDLCLPDTSDSIHSSFSEKLVPENVAFGIFVLSHPGPEIQVLPV
jgi:hypothetical protein